MPASNVDLAPVNALTIVTSGVYEINYMFNASASLGAAVTLAVRRNGAAIPSTEERHLLAIATESIYSGSVIETLSAGDIIDMAVSAAIALTLLPLLILYFVFNKSIISGMTAGAIKE